MKFTVASIEDNIVHIESQEAEDRFVGIDLLPSEVKEGDVLFYDGEKYTVDVAATEERRKAVYEKFNRLFRKK